MYSLDAVYKPMIGLNWLVRSVQSNKQ